MAYLGKKPVDFNDVTEAQTFTVTSLDANGGTIDGTVIGGTTPAAGTFTTGSFTDDVSFGDNDKAIFGAGSDLQIYHDGSNSYVKDAGTGNLNIQGNHLSLEDSTGTRFLLGLQGGETRIYNQGNEKLAATSTGIDVTGTVTSDGLTVDGSVDVNGATSFNLQTTGTNYVFNRTDAAPVLATQYNGTTNAQVFTGTDGSLSLRADPTDNLSGSYFNITVDGTTALTIDDSQNVGIGTAPATNYTQHTHNPNATYVYNKFTNSTTGNGGGGNGLDVGISGVNALLYNFENGTMQFATNGTERLRILSGGGITFNGDTATANALDDYEEGTWTPVLSGAGGSGTYEAAEASGSYVKIGRVVHVIGLVSLASSITGGGSSYAMISGLPFNYDQSFARGLSGPVKFSNVAYNSGSYVQAGREAGSDSDTIAFYESKPSTGLDAVQISEFSASDQVSFNLTYFTT